jgi:hypothetical protein
MSPWGSDHIFTNFDRLEIELGVRRMASEGSANERSSLLIVRTGAFLLLELSE